MREVKFLPNLSCVGVYLSSRTVASQVFSARQSLTSVFGMGTGGPSASITPTFVCNLLVEIVASLPWQSFAALGGKSQFRLKLTAALLSLHYIFEQCTFRDSNPGPTD